MPRGEDSAPGTTPARSFRPQARRELQPIAAGGQGASLPLRSPGVVFFAGAAVLGFALSRVVRSGLAHDSSAKTGPDEREAVNNATGIDV